MDSPGQVDSKGHVLVLFDGVCNLCNGTVQFIINRDPTLRFRFSSLQSAFSKEQLLHFNIDTSVLRSIMVIEDRRLYQKSDAVFRITSNLGGLWPVLSVFKILPRFIRDNLYDFIASRRYRYFGKTDSCMIPSPELKARFQD